MRCDDLGAVPTLRLVLSVLGLLTAPGCLWEEAFFCPAVPCPSCPPSIEVHITNGPITGLSATIPSEALIATCTEQVCTFVDALLPGSHQVVVSGDSVATTTLSVSVPGGSDEGCCPCGYETAVVEVALE